MAHRGFCPQLIYVQTSIHHRILLSPDLRQLAVPAVQPPAAGGGDGVAQRVRVQGHAEVQARRRHRQQQRGQRGRRRQQAQEVLRDLIAVQVPAAAEHQREGQAEQRGDGNGEEDLLVTSSAWMAERLLLLILKSSNHSASHHTWAHVNDPFGC